MFYPNKNDFKSIKQIMRNKFYNRSFLKGFCLPALDRTGFNSHFEYL